MEKLKADSFLKLNTLETTQPGKIGGQQTSKLDGNSGEFSKLLKKSIDELNQAQATSDQALADMATGQVKDLHQAAIAIGKAETSMKLMLEVRNKAISAYKEILRTQI